MNLLCKKLRTKSGATLSELLVAIAVLSLVTLAVAVGINASLRVYRQSVDLSDAQTLTSTLSQALMDELRYARDIRTEDGRVVYTSTSYGLNASISVDPSGQLLVSGSPLVGSGSYAGLTAGIQLEYNGTYIEVMLTISNADGPIYQAVFSVRPLNSI